MTIQTTYSQARAGLAKLMDQVTKDRELVVIKRRGKEDVAMISAIELESLVESAYLLRSPKNAERLLTALGRSLKNEGEGASVKDLKHEVGLVKKERQAVFQPEFIEDLRYWVETDRKLALRAFDLIEAILRDPFAGVGKPEPLKYLAPGVWSRRLTQEHRIVYLVRDDRIDFLQARYHY
jgi:toxin YoeB